MKYYITLIIAIIIIGFILFLSVKVVKQKKESVHIVLVPTPSIIPTKTVSQTIVYKNITYAYAYFEVEGLADLKLIPNFKEKKGSGELKREYTCKAGINGSYYDKEGDPLGGFTSGGNTLKKPISSRLMDGYVSIEGTKADIGFSPLPKASIILQAGPLLMINREVTTLRISSDEPARRSIGALTKGKKLLFITVYDPESTYLGPYLSQLPAIIQLISDTLPSPIISAINLDGGNASVFFNEEITLSELSPIGSLFCLR